MADELHELVGGVAVRRRHRDDDRFVGLAAGRVVALARLQAEARVQRALDRRRPRMAGRDQPQLQRQVPASPAAVENDAGASVDGVAADRPGIGEGVDEEGAARGSERRRLAAAGGGKKSPAQVGPVDGQQVGRVQAAALQAGRAARGVREDTYVEPGVLRRGGGHDALHHDDRRVG